jgi:hypothetical protein
METKLDPFWMALVLDKVAKTVTVAAFDPSKEKAEASAREREKPDAPMVCVNVTGDPKAFASKLSLWLAENDIVGAENAETIRSIASGLKKMMDETDRPKQKRSGRPLR